MLRQYELEHGVYYQRESGTAHLRRIHGYIFQDVYPFAGEFRTEPIAKGNTPFCNYLFIEENLNSLFDRLKSENYLRNLKPKDFSSKAAFYMSEMNIIHPFRERNGRSIREFIRQLALECGYNIEWSLVEQKVLLNAMITAVSDGLEPLTVCICQVIEDN